MSVKRVALPVLTVVCCLAFSHPASADETFLDKAENAYRHVDPEGTYENARKALEEGGHSSDQTARIYELLGFSAAVMHNADEAQDYYIRMLGLRPDKPVDRSLAPRLRGPFLEARGFWIDRDAQLRAEVELSGDGKAAVVRLGDPAEMVDKLRLGVQLAGDEEPRQFELSPQRVQRVDVQGLGKATEAHYYLVVSDEWGNRLIELGYEGSMEQLKSVDLTRGDGTQEPEEETSALASPWLWTAVGLVLAGGAVAAGFLLREKPVDGQTMVTIGSM